MPMPTLVLLVALVAPAATGDEAVLRAALHEAVAAGAATVTLPPGRYVLTPGEKAHLLLENVTNLAIDATGVELVQTDPRQTLLALYGCRNVSLTGLTCDADPLPFTQGVVAAVEEQGQWLDFRLAAGYPADPATFQRGRPLSIFDPVSREFKHSVPDLFFSRLEELEPGLWRVHPVTGTIGRHAFPADRIAVGDLAVLPLFGAPALSCRGSVDIAFRQVTVYAAGAMAFHEHAGGGGTELTDCRVMLRPGTDRLISTNSDGFHSKNQARGPRVTGCLFEGMHDDGINIHGMFSRVAETTTGVSVLTAPAFHEWSNAGDTVLFYRPPAMDLIARRTVAGREQVRDPAALAQVKDLQDHGHHLAYRLELTEPVDLQRGDLMIPLSYSGRGFTIRGNTFRRHRYRAMLIRTSDGVIEDNVITGVTNDAISLVSEPGGEGGFVDNVTVRRNQIRGVGMLPWHCAAIRVGLDGREAGGAGLVHRHIVIEDNLIDDVAGDGIRLDHALGVTLRDNQISRVGERRVGRVPEPVAIRIGRAAQVLLTGNVFAPGGLAVSPEAEAGGVWRTDQPE